MDIIDIILAKKLTPQGQIETYARTSQQAVANANQAVATVEAAAEDIEEKQAAANDLLEQAQEALQTAQEAQIAMPEVYTTTGQNTDGYMTQKAVTDALDTKASVIYVNNNLANKVDNSTLNNYATTTYVNQKIANIPSSSMPSGISNLGVDAAGKIVVVGSDGNIIAGDVTEEAIIDALIQSGAYSDKETLGLIIDYNNKNYERTSGAINRVAGTDFNSFAMYGGRMRCNVADDGTINAFYGDNNYIEDGSNGQVMIYQPKFYYQRIIIESYTDAQGQVINKEQLLISSTPKLGFKLHPLFINSNNEELDYVLLPAYEGNVYDTSTEKYMLYNDDNIDINADKLSSISGAYPLSGINKTLNLNNLKQLATNRGEGWQLSDIYSESALQMLMMVEFGSMNGQRNLGKGIVNAVNLGQIITGSTASLGNGSGMAASTLYSNGNSYTEEDKIAISYRGMENPWGNLWRIVDKITIKGNGGTYAGVPYINNEFSTEINLPKMIYGWISNMGIGNTNYDWLYMPIKCNNSANSAMPVGDTIWTQDSLNGVNKVTIGGHSGNGDGAGLFDYECDTALNTKINKTNARIMFVPTKNNIYNNNIIKWQQHYGG